MKKSKAELAALTQSIKEKLASGKMKITLAPALRVHEHPEIRDFVLQSIQHPEALITDESCLSDFPFWYPGIRLLILDHYQVDIDPVKDETLAEIFAYIARKPPTELTAEALAAELGLRRSRK